MNQEDSNMPWVHLYHYTKAESLEKILETKGLLYTKLAKSNDIMELLASGATRTWNIIRANEALLPTVVCMSTRMSSPVMWQRYAGDYTGACLVFKILLSGYTDGGFLALPYKDPDVAEFLKTSELKTSSLKTFQFWPVSYAHDNKRPVFPREYQDLTRDENVVLLKRFLREKGKDWECEREIRFIHEINSAEKLCHAIFPYLVGVVLGPKFDMSRLEHIKELIQKNSKHPVVIEQARLHPTKYEIKSRFFADTDIDDVRNHLIAEQNAGRIIDPANFN